MSNFLIFVYIAAGVWAANRTIYTRYMVFGKLSDIIWQKIMFGMFLGWILIPIALIGLLRDRRKKCAAES